MPLSLEQVVRAFVLVLPIVGLLTRGAAVVHVKSGALEDSAPRTVTALQGLQHTWYQVGEGRVVAIFGLIEN